MFVFAAKASAVAGKWFEFGDQRFEFAVHKFSIAGKALHVAHLCACTGVFPGRLACILF